VCVRVCGIVQSRAECSVSELVVEFIEVVHVSQKLSPVHKPPNNVRDQLLWNGRLTIPICIIYICVCVCFVYMCVCIYLFIYLLIYLFNLFIHVFMSLFICTCIYVHISIYLCGQTRIQTHITSLLVDGLLIHLKSKHGPLDNPS
jgi:hypothetical protein